jgi:hypothetical protein
MHLNRLNRLTRRPRCILWNRMSQRGFALDEQYHLIPPPVDLSTIPAGSIIREDYNGTWFPSYCYQLPDWVILGHVVRRNPLTRQVELVKPGEWVAYWLRPATVPDD